MKTRIPLAATLLVASFTWAQVTHRTAPGIRQAEQAESQSEKTMPPPTYQRSAPDLARLRQNAQELATLAESIPSDVDQTTKGILAKDLDQKLKRIEKLSKQLRSELNTRP